MKRILQPNERHPEVINEVHFNGQRLRNAISDQRGATFPAPVMEGQTAVFACCRRLQSEPFLQVQVQAVLLGGKLQWALLQSYERARGVDNLFPNHHTIQ